MSNVQVTPITGLPQVNGWAQVITHPSRSLICVLSVSGKNANSVGKTLAEQVAHFQIENSARLHNALLDLLQNARQENCILQFACILLTDGKSILATHSGSVFLKRKNRVGEILVSEGELKIIEGARMPEDVFILATRQAVQYFPELKNILHQSTEELATRVVADLHGKENSSLSAFAWIEQSEEAESAAVSENMPPLSRGRLNAGALLEKVKKLAHPRFLKNSLLTARRFSRNLLARLPFGKQPENGVFTKKNRPLSRNFLIAAGAAILLLGGVIAWKQRQVNQEIATLQPRLGELEQQLADARGFAESEPITARSMAKEVLRGLEDLIAQNQEKQQAVKKLKEVYQEAQEFSATIAGTENQQLEPFFDLRLAEASFVAQDAVVNENSLLALDAAGQRAVILNLETKQTQQVVFDSIGTGRALAADGETLFVLADGLHAFDLTDNNEHTLLKEQGDSDRAGTLLKNFTVYLYVFNPEERNIYRYLRGEDGLSDPIGWLVDKQGLEFSAVSSLAVDGDLWLGTDSGGILKYTQGQPQSFSVSDLPTAFDSPLKIATYPDSEYLFVLEKTRRRLVILRKDGSFLKEIVSDALASAETLAASETEPAVYAISGSLVYKISY